MRAGPTRDRRRQSEISSFRQQALRVIVLASRSASATRRRPAIIRSFSELTLRHPLWFPRVVPLRFFESRFRVSRIPCLQVLSAFPDFFFGGHNRIYMSEDSVLTVEPRWPAALALLSIGGLHYALPSELSVGPDWLVLVVVAALAIPATIFHHRGNWREPFLGPCGKPGRDSVGCHLPRFADLAPSRARGSARTVVTLGKCPLDLQPAGFRLLVLEA